MSALKSNKGMTFVELLVSIIVLSVLVPTISGCIFSTIQTYVWSKNYSDMCSVISTIDGTIERELAFADNPSVNSGAITYVKTGSQPKKLETKEVEFKGKTISVLYINDVLAFDPAFYKGVGVEATFSVDSNIVNVTVVYNGVVRHSSVFAVSKI